MKRIAVSGAAGKMGQAVCAAVGEADDLELVARIDPDHSVEYHDVATALTATKPDVLVDFTTPASVEANVRAALAGGVDCVVGTTGMAAETLDTLKGEIPDGTCLFVAPNFAIGAVLLMELSARAARFLPDVEIIELHHNFKQDSPSGTALRTAELIGAARLEAGAMVTETPGAESEIAGGKGARGAFWKEVPIHSVRLPGLVAHEEVIFGGPGQTLTLRHDSMDRTSFMPGVLLACREVGARTGLIVGLENLMEL